MFAGLILAALVALMPGFREEDNVFRIEGTTEAAIQRLLHMSSETWRPKAVVLEVGTENIAKRPASEETTIDTIRGIRRVIEVLRCHWPEAKIVLRPLGSVGGTRSVASEADGTEAVPPVASNAAVRDRCERVNREIRYRADGSRVFWCGDAAELRPTLDYALGVTSVTGGTRSVASAAPACGPFERPVAKAYEPSVSGWFDYRVSPKREEIKAHASRHYDAVFMGDSITHLWEERAIDVQKEFLGQYDILNLGFSGDRTQGILWDCENGLLDGYTTDAVSLMIGTNNRKDSAEDVAKGIGEIVKAIRAYQPQARILLFNLFPRGAKPDDADRAKNASVNALIRKLADGEHVVYVDLWNEFLEPDGTISTSIFSDYLHPTAEGYAIWAKRLAILLREGRALSRLQRTARRPSLPSHPHGGVRFPRPNVIPEPVSLGYEADKLCRLEDSSTVRVACDDPTAAAWVSQKLRAWLRVSPKVERVAFSGTNGVAGAYRLTATPDGVFTLLAKDLEGVRNAFYTLRMCLMSERGVAEASAWIAPALDVTDAPAHGFRAMHVCWMPETRLMTIERQIRLAAYFKFNCLILEFWGTYDSAAYPWFGWREHKVPTSEVKRLVALGRDLGVTLVPALNCFGHASMARRSGGKHTTLDLDARWQPLFEPREGWVWCLTNPETQKVIRTLVSEMYETFDRPGYFHIGCDESDPPSCPVCAATDWTKTVADHIRGVRDHVASLGARTLMWHDMLVSRKDPRWQGESFTHYPINGASKEECERLLSSLPKDVVICDWYYNAPLADYPTWDYFKSFGFDVTPSAWQDMVGAKSMGEAALRKGTFGFMGTTWHHAYNADLYCCYLGAAEAAWGSSGRVRMETCDFATRWRQVGWDMNLKSKADCGYSEDEIPRHTSTPH